MPDISEWLENVSDDVREANPDVFGEARSEAVPSESHLEQKFLDLWKRVSDVELDTEYRFHEDRRWRFDFADQFSRTAIELEGGVWSQGRHTRGQGFIDDCQKYNEAVMRGWAVIRIPEPLLTLQYVERIAGYMGVKRR